jgi:hypothetical protein
MSESSRAKLIATLVDSTPETDDHAHASKTKSEHSLGVVSALLLHEKTMAYA